MHIVCWNSQDGSLEQVIAANAFKQMGSSIHGSSSTYLLDCLEAAEAAGSVYGKTLELAIKNGHEYIDLSDSDTMTRFWASSFDCVSMIFDDESWSETIKVIS